MFRNFSLDEVVLSDSEFCSRRDLVKKYILEFDVDRLMHNFRRNAQLESNAVPLGGWESEDCGLRGHFVGHYLSACSKFYFSEKNAQFKIKTDEIVDILEACAAPNGYLSAFEERVLDVLELEENRNVWAPYYTLHKILQGLIDCNRYTGNPKALILALNLGRYIAKRFKKLSYWKIDGILRCTKVNPVNEFGGIGDALYSLYELTKEHELLELAKIFDRKYFIEPLAAGEDLLENLHANVHLPLILSAMHRYELTKENKYRVASENFYRFLLGRTFANGSNSSKATAFIKGGVSEKSEHWGAFGLMGDALTGGESESCCGHNTEKIVEHLIEWQTKSEYFRHLEILKYNAVLNSLSRKTGMSQYHQPMGTGAVKKFSGFYDTFWCCTASGIEAASELQKNIWFKEDNTLLVNLFISSKAIWKEKDLTITQESQYPDGLCSTLRIEAERPTRFTLLLREDRVSEVQVFSNNQLDTREYKRENGFILIDRLFCDQDRIQIKIQSPLQLMPLPGDSDRYAIRYGSVLLAQLGDNEFLGEISEDRINQELIRTDDHALRFYMDGRDCSRHHFIPLYRVEDEQYTVYFNANKATAGKTRFEAAKDGSSAYDAEQT